MKFIVDTSFRSTEPEIMDDFDMKGQLLRDTLDKLGKINKWLGGNRITLNGISHLLKSQPKQTTYEIIDLGCGHGESLRLVADFGRRHNFNFKLLGIDANQDAIDYANSLSQDYPEIGFQKMDIFSDEFESLNYDIALSTLFLHHFNKKEIEQLIKSLTKTANLGLVINDLHRNQLAYLLFRGLGLFISNEMIVKDGLTSILRAFKRKDLESFSNQLGLNSQIRWKWAFRYQWIIKT